MHVNVEKLCARCHGLIYNDWQNGTHGVRRGHFLTPTEFEIINFKCTECHDPHSPVFQFKEYAPPPVWPDKFVRRGNQVIVHSATGQDFQVPVLKNINQDKKWKDPSAPVAMSAVSAHMDKLECYGCHASWVPQCYVKVDYSRDKDGKQKSGIDWVASGNAKKKNGQIIPKKYSVQIPGIPKLKFDWSKIVERDGTQVATVGTHWPMSRALNKEELDTLLRAGTCMGCHQNMTDKKLWEKVSEKGTLDPKQHLEMMNKMIKYMAEKAQKGTDW